MSRTKMRVEGGGIGSGSIAGRLLLAALGAGAALLPARGVRADESMHDAVAGALAKVSADLVAQAPAFGLHLNPHDVAFEKGPGYFIGVAAVGGLRFVDESHLEGTPLGLVYLSDAATLGLATGYYSVVLYQGAASSTAAPDPTNHIWDALLMDSSGGSIGPFPALVTAPVHFGFPGSSIGDVAGMHLISFHTTDFTATVALAERGAKKSTKAETAGPDDYGIGTIRAALVAAAESAGTAIDPDKMIVEGGETKAVFAPVPNLGSIGSAQLYGSVDLGFGWLDVPRPTPLPPGFYTLRFGDPPGFKCSPNPESDVQCFPPPPPPLPQNVALSFVATDGTVVTQASVDLVPSAAPSTLARPIAVTDGPTAFIGFRANGFIAAVGINGPILTIPAETGSTGITSCDLPPEECGGPDGLCCILDGKTCTYTDCYNPGPCPASYWNPDTGGYDVAIEFANTPISNGDALFGTTLTDHGTGNPMSVLTFETSMAVAQAGATVAQATRQNVVGPAGSGESEGTFDFNRGGHATLNAVAAELPPTEIGGDPMVLY